MGLNGWVVANIGWIVFALAALAGAAFGVAGWLAVRLTRAEQRYNT